MTIHVLLWDSFVRVMKLRLYRLFILVCGLKMNEQRCRRLLCTCYFGPSLSMKHWYNMCLQVLRYNIFCKYWLHSSHTIVQHSGQVLSLPSTTSGINCGLIWSLVVYYHCFPNFSCVHIWSSLHIRCFVCLSQYTILLQLELGSDSCLEFLPDILLSHT